MAFLYVYSELPFWHAWVFAISVVIPVYLCNSYLTNFLQPKAMQQNVMGFFIVEFLVATLTMLLIFISVTYIFLILDRNGHFPSADIFEEMATIREGMLTTVLYIFKLIKM